MKKIISGSIILSKLGFLACFTLMGFWTNISAATEPIMSCHQTKDIKSDLNENDCHACELSKKAWDKEFVNSNFLQEIVVSQYFVPNFFDTETLINFASIVINRPNPPPDEDQVWHSHLISKNSIVLVI